MPLKINVPFLNFGQKIAQKGLSFQKHKATILVLFSNQQEIKEKMISGTDP